MLNHELLCLYPIETIMSEKQNIKRGSTCAGGKYAMLGIFAELLFTSESASPHLLIYISMCIPIFETYIMQLIVL